MNALVRQGFAPTTMSEAVEFSKMLSDSQMVPKQYQGKPNDILVAMQMGYEVGLAPMQSLQNIAVINGKPSIYGDAAMAMVQNSPVCEDIEESIEGDGTPNPVAVCIARRKGRKPVTARFSVEDAKRAGLWGKQGPWTQYPKRMLQMRARGFALRDAFPDVLKGLITAEEAMDYPVEAKSSYKAPAEVIENFNPPVTPDPVIPANFDDLESDLDDAPAVEQTQGRFQLYLPTGEVYSTHETIDEYIEAYGDLVHRVRGSSKLDENAKLEKIRALKTANLAVRKGLGAAQLARLVEVTQGPGDDSPKG